MIHTTRQTTLLLVVTVSCHILQCVESFSALSPNVQSWLNSNDDTTAFDSIEDASMVLTEWDKYYTSEFTASAPGTMSEVEGLRVHLPQAVTFLAESAAAERAADSTQGRCMLGICASSTEEGIMTLKSWVTTLQLPRGLLHGADKDGVPLEIEGGVYIKYNSGGVYSFEDIRKSGLGFDALWKPGDALLEPYDGDYRGVYFQVELVDGEFRQFLVPLETFTL